MLRKHSPFIALLLVFIAVVLTNFSFSKFLIGWDNLLPELGLGINIKRSIFSVWQEYQGLGLLAGNGHAAELPRQIILLLFSYVLPLNWIRQIYIFSMLLTGALGVYFLIKKLLLFNGNDFSAQTISLLGGLYYLLNLATVQIFYVPFEPFVAHFAFLPWLVLSAVIFIKNPSRKTIIFFIIINVLALPQAQVPTLFIVYFFVILMVTSILNLGAKSRQFLKNSLKLLALTLIINSLWLFPFIYFMFTNSSVAVDAKINQMATETVFLQNKEFGNISDVMLLKGFWFNNVDPNIQGNFTYMLSTWRNHIANPLIEIVGYLFFGIITLGFLSALKTKKAVYIAFCALFILSFTMLATDTSPFSWIDSLFRQIPLLSQVFRFPFTKFANIALLTYAVFFALGFEKIRSSSLLKMEKLKSYFLPFILVALLIAFVFPMFKGNLFYNKAKISIPSEYNELFDFFKSQNPNTRIANFPQYTFWGWSFYNWGYGGSGFLWYGIKQPILDRAFDVWSNYNENYYWEVSQAVYSKNPDLFEKVLNKYQINWLIIDKNVINPQSPKALFTPELKDLIKEVPSIQKAQNFGNMEIFKVNLKDDPKNFVFTTNNLPSINNYSWNDHDIVYSQFGNYISQKFQSNYLYPFRSLFSGKNEEDREFEIKQDDKNIEFTAKLGDFSNPMLNIPNLSEGESVVVSEFVIKKNDDNNYSILAQVKTPQIYILRKDSKTSKEEKVFGETISYPLFSISRDIKLPIKINVNGVANFTIDSLENNESIGTSVLSLTQDNIIVLSNRDSNGESQTIQAKVIVFPLNNLSKKITLNDFKNGDSIKIKVSKAIDGYQGFETWPNDDMKKQVENCDTFRHGEVNSTLVSYKQEKLLKFESKNATACFSFNLPSLDHRQSFISFVENRNIKGKPLHFWILNEDEKFAPIDTYLAENKSLSSSYFVIPPMEQFGAGYSLHFDNISIGKDKTVNELGKVSMFYIPYSFITSLYFDNLPFVKLAGRTKLNKVSHPNESLYQVEYEPGANGTIVLSQGFDKGWKAYRMENGKWSIINSLKLALPFIFGKELKNHVMVNNWENGWIIDEDNSQLSTLNSQLVILFLPQYLEYLGFILTIGVFIYIVLVIRMKFV